ncbi:MAG: hypothetical protein SOY57_07680 [Ruminococcus bromii]|nr:hypothetical protein [Ruminococcus bromii]
MTQEQIDKQIEYLRSQKVNPTGNYRRYLVNLYNMYYNGAKQNGTDWCPNISIREKINAAYEGVAHDHMAFDMVQKWDNDLKKLGYIRHKKENGEWRTYIIKGLDF